jgi:hypothetical protein
LPLELDLPEHTDGIAGAALPIIWARTQIEDRMIAYLSPALEKHQRDAIQQEVTALGLEHRLMTQWTSFVAVAKQVVNPGGQGASVDVEVPKVAGVSDSAYPPSALPATKANGVGVAVATAQLGVGKPGSAFPETLKLASAAGFTGHSGPEPASWLALMAIGITAGVLWWRRAAAH